MQGTYFDPFSECWRFFTSFMSCGCPTGRRFHTRQEKIEELEKIKKNLQQEISGIDEMIEELKSREAKQS
jgi:peptidoglycan hydrolase CwlO-like protein